MTPYRIDVHHHYVTARLVEQLARASVQQIGGAPLPAWTLEDSMAMMACFDPVFEELDRRGAVVFVHPAVSTGGRIATDPPARSPVPTLEPSLLVFDTTRAAVNLVVSGTLARYPRVRLILAHAGGRAHRRWSSTR
jgi:predicted TIM-barrel fold metal-dependent hydrolase